MSEPYIAQISLFGGNFAPRGWAFCDGQILSIAQNTALFSLVGTTYGGNGQTTFALPDLRGRVPMHPGQGPGLSNRDLGETGGRETVTLVLNEIPAHTHPIALGQGTGGVTVGHLGANTSGSAPGSASTGVAGGSQPHENLPPFLCLNFIIALQGVFPSRN